MAYVRNVNPLDDQSQETGVSDGIVNSPFIVHQSNVGPSGAVGDQSVSPTNPNAQKVGAGGFVNLQKYLQANQGGAQQLGQNVSGALDTAKNTATSAMDTAGKEFTGKVQEATNIWNPDVVNAAANDASSYLKSEPLAKQLSGTYTGPQNYAGSDQDISAQKALLDAREKQLLAGDVGGRTQLIRNIVNTPGTKQTTAGGLNLNQFLLQNTAPAFQQVKSAADAIEPLGEVYASDMKRLQEGVQSAQKTNAATKEQALARLGQGTTDLQSQITKMMEERQAALDTAAKNAQYTDLKSAGATDAQIAAYQTADAAAKAYGKPGVDIRNYVTNETAARLGTKDVATPEQAEDLDALAQLQGLQNNFLYSGEAGKGPSVDINNILGTLQGQTNEGMYEKAIADQQAAYAEQQRIQQEAALKAAADAKAAQEAALAQQQAQYAEYMRQQQAQLDAQIAEQKRQQDAALAAQLEQQRLIQEALQKLIDAQTPTPAPAPGPAPAPAPGPYYGGSPTPVPGEDTAPPLPRIRDDVTPVIDTGGGGSGGGGGEGSSAGTGGSSVGGMSTVGPDGVAVGVSTGVSNTTAANIGMAVAGPIGVAIAIGINEAINAIGQADANAVNAAAQDGPAPGVAPSAAANAAPSGVAPVGPDAQAAIEGMISADAAAAAAAQADAAPADDGTTAGISAAIGEAPGMSEGEAAAASQADSDSGVNGSVGDAAPGDSAPGDSAPGDSGAVGDSATGDGSDGDGGSVGDGSGDGSGGDGGGGGGGGGGKIICTAMNDLYGLPYRENRIWTKYSITHMKPEHQRGYHKVFLPLVDYAYHQDNKWANKKVRSVLEWIARERTQAIKDELAGVNPRPVLRVVRKSIEGIIYFIGKMTKGK